MMEEKTFDINNRRYLGGKAKLVNFIHDVVERNCTDVQTVLDIFAGTGVVGYSFNQECSVLINDNLTSNELVYQTFLGKTKVSEKKLARIISEYNAAVPTEENYYSLNFADTYLSRQNMRKVGYIRDNIDRLYRDQKINRREQAILISSLLYAIDHIANTVGHYDAYRKNGDLSATLHLLMPNLEEDQFNVNNHIFAEDANQLAQRVKADLVYIDPPYNSRQYCDAYHFLENVSQNAKPEVYGVARKMDRHAQKSKYCTSKAPAAFADLVEKLDTRYILVSYSDTGKKGNDRSNAKINDEQILDILRRKGKVQIFEQEYNIFTTGKTKITDHKERLFLCTVGISAPSIEVTSKDTRLIKSPLNYTGGKHKILDQLVDKFPDDIDVFYDVFCGGANVGINMDTQKIVCIDNNERLIELLTYLQESNYYKLVRQLDKLIEMYHLSDTYRKGYAFYGCTSDKGVGQYNKVPYQALKSDYNRSNGERSDLFLLLIIFGFNNQIRFNSKGEFNLPVGKRDFNGNLRHKLERFMAALKAKPITFQAKDFRNIDLKRIDHQDTFFYLDPPYYLGTASYNENNGWTNQDEEDLLAFLDQCNERQIRFALSNVIEHRGKINDRLLNWCLEGEYNINYINRNYQNSNYQIKDKTAVTKEVLITNY